MGIPVGLDVSSKNMERQEREEKVDPNEWSIKMARMIHGGFVGTGTAPVTERVFTGQRLPGGMLHKDVDRIEYYWNTATRLEDGGDYIGAKINIQKGINAANQFLGSWTRRDYNQYRAKNLLRYLQAQLTRCNEKERRRNR